MSIEEVVKRLASKLATARAQPVIDVIGVDENDLRALLDAYRGAKERAEYYVRAHDDACTELISVYAERDAAQSALKLANDRSLADTRELMAELEGARADASTAKVRFEEESTARKYAQQQLNEFQGKLASAEGELARIKKYGDHTNASCSMLGARCVDLEKENARLKIAMSQWHVADELARAQELLASARAQGEAHLRARMEAEALLMDERWAKTRLSKNLSAAFENLSTADTRNADLKSRFRRLAKRYLGLRKEFRDDVADRSWRWGNMYTHAMDQQARAEASEKKLNSIRGILNE